MQNNNNNSMQFDSLVVSAIHSQWKGLETESFSSHCKLRIGLTTIPKT